MMSSEVDNNATDANGPLASSHRDDDDKENGPLHSHRDPRRSPLLSRMPFTPAPRSAGGSRPASAARGTGRKDVTPAYAYKNAETGLLEIRTGIPPSLSMVANEDDTVVGLDDGSTLANAKLALYPIALNGGGAGLYRDPREFANGNVAGFSTNNRTASSRRAPLKSHVRFAWPYEIKKAAVRFADGDLEAGLGPSLSGDDDDRTTRTRQSIGTLASAMNPWKIWENVHNEMSRRAALRTQRLEDEASHVTLARQKNKAARVSSVYNDDDYDFALVLAPHEAYAFWAAHLDFREEALHLVDEQQGPEIEELDDDGQDDDSTIATATCGGDNQKKSEGAHATSTPKSPVDGSGLRRRKRVTPNSDSKRLDRFNSVKNTPASMGRVPSHRSPYRVTRNSERVFSQRKSLFERALDRLSPPGLSQRNLSALHESGEAVSPTASTSGSRRRSGMSPYVQRRRWGNNYDANKLSSPNLTSPPIHSLKKGGSSQKRRPSSNIFQWSASRRSARGGGSGKKSATKASGKRGRDDDELETSKEGEDMFFASPGVPRGIAARVNGLGQFLEALKIGIVVRRHWPKGKSVFVQLFSDDGGDSIQFKFIPDDEAVIALREQEQRYNGRRRKKKARVSFGEFASHRMSRDSATVTTHNEKLDSSVPLPDYLKAKIDREEDFRKKGGVLNTISHNALAWQNTFAVESKLILQVQPATHIDPFSKEGEKLGTSSLRQSSTKYVKRNTFSVIVPSMQGKLIQDHSSIDLTEKWCEGEHPSLFKSLDIEMATEGEYWMVLKGFILLHRDASTGRFAAQRAGGFGSYYRHAEGLDKREDDGRAQTFTEALPPPKTLMQKLLRKGDDEDEAEEYTATAPPSDYFLGFSSPGTQIWGRLRQAGLETQRLYALDTRKVMLKVRCPADRLQDVAEALKLKLKTKDGDFAPFREDMIAQFEPTDDGFVSCEDDVERVVSLFRSSERQKIIDFIIGSRIRDSGAELGRGTELGKQIQRRVPLHSHMRLESLYNTWVLFWYQSNWTGRDGTSLHVGKKKSGSTRLISDGASKKRDEPSEDSDSASIKSSSSQVRMPHFFHRFFVGCFYMPLDSIEEYYGEKVAFYFAWLQHCSFHLLYLSVMGLIVFICQLVSGNWDHPLRPWFSIVVMIWSFVVVVTWRRRSNLLAYQWGTLDYKEEEVARPEFKGTEYRVDPVTRTYVPYYPPWKRWLKMCISIPLTLGFTIVTLLGILILYGNRDVMLANYFASGTGQSFEPSFTIDAIGKTSPILSVELNTAHLHDPNFWLIILGFPTLLGLVLPLLNFGLRRVSLWLNEIENHRTEAEHRTHFIIKVFAFRFVCYFAALYYYSFIGVGTDDPQATEHGILRVASTLFTYLTFAHWWNIFLNVFFPLLLYRWRVYRERLRLRNELRELEMTELELSPSNEQEKTPEERLELKKQLLNKRLLLEHAQVNIWEEMMLPEHDSFTEYLFAVTQFAYVTCFSVVLPITPLIVLINHLVNMRLDAYKICRGRRRPLSQKTGGIGVWSHVLHIVTVIAILTNCSLMALTSSQFSWLADQIGKLGVFALAIGWEHLMLLVKYIMQLTVSTMPVGVQNEVRRKKYEQERKRYMTLRAKKERRSGSVGGALDKSQKSQNDSDDKGGDAVDISESFKTSPCPPIRESSAESYHSRSSDENQSQEELAKPLIERDSELAKAKPATKKDGAFEEKPSGRSLVNVRATMRHSPLNGGRSGSYRHGSQQKLQGRHPSAQQQSTSKLFASFDTATYEENSHPNLEEAIGRLPLEPARSSSRRSPLESFSPDEESPSYMPYSDTKRNGGGLSNARGYGAAAREADTGHSPLHGEEIISPSSSLSTIPRMPTPRNLNLDSDNNDDDSLYTVDDGFATPGGYYPDATAPPLSPGNRGYSARKTTSFGSSYFGGYSVNDDDGDNDGGPRAKWGVGAILQYARSERSLSLSESKVKRR